MATILTQTGEEVQGILNDISKLISITYSELVELRNSKALSPGSLYRITDYITTTAQEGTQSVGHPFDVIALALSESELSEQAWTIQSARDTDGYFANSQLSAWKIWYCLDNDISRFAWANATNGKGVIYRMIDEHNNDCPYDFKNIIYNFNGVRRYTFGSNCYNNQIKSNKVNGVRILNKNIFNTGCHDNKLGYNCTSIIFEVDCSQNVLGNNCQSVNFLRGCVGNNIGYNCNGISFGFFNNRIKIGDDNNTITISDRCSYIQFGGRCNNIRITPLYCRYLTFEPNVSSIELNNDETASGNVQVEKYLFVTGLSNLSLSVRRNNICETTIAADSSGNVKEFCIADLIQ